MIINGAISCNDYKWPSACISWENDLKEAA